VEFFAEFQVRFASGVTEVRAKPSFEVSELESVLLGSFASVTRADASDVEAVLGVTQNDAADVQRGHVVPPWS